MTALIDSFISSTIIENDPKIWNNVCSEADQIGGIGGGGRKKVRMTGGTKTEKGERKEEKGGATARKYIGTERRKKGRK